MNSTAIATIDLCALRHNLNLIREKMPNQKIMAMVKSNAYGHGLIRVAEAIDDVDAFGVATIAEAMQLKETAIKTDIVVMRGFSTKNELPYFFDDPQLLACIHDENQIALLETMKTSAKSLRIWLKVDTGMHRLGVPYVKFKEMYERLMALPFIVKPFVICSHLADADNDDACFTQQQIAVFDALIKNKVEEKSLLNSAGVLAYSDSRYDWIRPGLILYGVSPFAHDSKHRVLMNDFKPVMTLESRLIAVKTISAGEKIGYSCSFTAPYEMKIGIVGMGYGDSYPRHAKSGTPVLIRGERCPIVGRVSMDMITVDVSHLPDVEINDTVILWGDSLSVAEIAHYVNTIPHELLCHLTGRVQLVYRN